VACAFDGWKLHEMKLDEATKSYKLDLMLPEGEQSYKFQVDGEFKTDFTGNIGVDDEGQICNTVS
jgi:hypothetical protein